MKIERITLTHVRVPLVEPFKISNGVIAEKDGILVSVASEGLTGIGESSPMAGSFYSDDTPDSVWDALRDIIVPRLLTADLKDIQAVNTLLESLQVSPFAAAGMETAFWDLEAQRAGLSLARYLGAHRDTVESGLAVGMYPSIPALLGAIERYLSEGYTRVKIKIQPGWDVEPLEAVRKKFGEIPLMVDANCAYTRNQLNHLRSLDGFGLTMIEQPFAKEDLESHAALQAVIETPVCLDESAKDAATVRRAIALKSCRIVNIKIQRVGGLQHAREIHDICAASGIPVWGGTMPELGIGGIQTVHMSALNNFTYPTDVESSLRWFVDDIVEPFITVERGHITVPSAPGNGCRLNTRNMQRFFVREQSFPRKG